MGIQPTFTASGKFVDDSRSRAIVERLRERYADARALVAAARAWPPHHAHLEWILGPRRNRDLDGAALDREVSELVVLWLEDLALELEVPCWPESSSGSGAATTQDADARRSVAQNLRAATRDFAGMLMGPGMKLASES